MSIIGIDVETKFKNNLIRRLNKLKAVDFVSDGGAYRQDESYSKVYVKTTMAEGDLDDWLYRRGLK